MSSALVEKSNDVETTVRKVRKTSKAPSDDMTVEEHLQREFEQLENKVRSHTNEKIQMIQAEFNRLKNAMLAAAGMGEQETTYQVTLQAIEGPYAGTSWVRTLKLSAPGKGRGRAKRDKSKSVSIFIGRSKAAKYVKSGVSLSKDDSVSTTHAEIVLIRGKGLFLEDRGSTNGTTVDGTELVAMTPIPLVDGQKIFFGSLTQMSVDIQTVE
eukprot:INCI16199.5.p1 GENE.INCI16199.5~~INCI16199.5.p1  ORF type:complete len:211 (+),score=44.48 INCI16199.5:360-992(+)